MVRMRPRALDPEVLLGRDLLSQTPQTKRLRARLRDGDALEAQRVRVYVCLTLVALAFICVFARLGAVMTPHQRSAAAVPLAIRDAVAPRASITDRNGTLLATDLPSRSLYADPRVLRDPERTARALARILPQLDMAGLARRLSRRESSFVWVRRHISPREAEAILRLGIPGLEFLNEPRRGYPAAGAAAHVVGFTDPDRRGLAGVEHAFEKRLAGNTTPLTLSLDLRVQHALKTELSAALVRFSGIGAAGLVMDAHSGEILAMASLPDFHPGQRGTISPESAFNRAALGVYELGSVFKLFTFASALEAKPELMQARYDVSRPIRTGRYTITDYKPEHGILSFPEVLVRSSNIGTVQVMQDLGPEQLRRGFAALGLTDRVRLELPETGTPILPDVWRPANYMTASYGHGIAVSPLQTVRALAALVNGGLLPKPTLLKNAPAAPAPRVLSPETSDAMRKLMRLAVLEGTGGYADAEGYAVGGKTGTADKLDPNGGYTRGARIATFVSAFPMDDPRYVLFVMVDEPKGREDTYGYATAGWVSAPATRGIVERIAPLLGVAPHKQQKSAAVDALSLAVLDDPASAVPRRAMPRPPMLRHGTLPVSYRVASVAEGKTAFMPSPFFDPTALENLKPVAFQSAPATSNATDVTTASLSSAAHLHQYDDSIASLLQKILYETSP